MAKKFHLSARGHVVNFDELIRVNPKSVAVGNARMNARGDRIGLGGKVITKVEDVPESLMADPNAAYNKKNPNAIKLVSLKDDVKSTSKNDTNAQVFQTGFTPEDFKAADAKSPLEAMREHAQQVSEEKKRKIVDKE